jgi:NAD(P)H-flavin reductase
VHAAPARPVALVQPGQRPATRRHHGTARPCRGRRQRLRSARRAVRPGERLWLGPPFGTGLLPPHPGSRRDLLLIAGGTGLAPLRALIEHVAETGGRRRVTLVVGARTLTDLYDPITLDKLQTAHDWLTIRPALSHDPTAPPDERGTAVTIALRHACPDHDVYVCGPPPMIRHALPRLLTAGIPANRIHLPDTFDRSDCPL